MKLLEAMQTVTIEDRDVLLNIYYALEDRKDTLEMQEPDWDQEFFYEKWEEKNDDFCAIFEEFEYIVEELGVLDEDKDDEEIVLSDEDMAKLNEKLIKVKDGLELHQFQYGGLKRLSI